MMTKLRSGQGKRDDATAAAAADDAADQSNTFMSPGDTKISFNKMLRKTFSGTLCNRIKTNPDKMHWWYEIICPLCHQGIQ